MKRCMKGVLSVLVLTVGSSLFAEATISKFGYAYYSTQTGTGMECWGNKDASVVFADESILIPVTGVDWTKDPLPEVEIVHGSTDAGDIAGVVVRTDEEIYNELLISESETSDWPAATYFKFESMWEWEDDSGYYWREAPKSVWPSQAVVSNRVWIQVTPNPSYIGGHRIFAVRLKGTDQVTAPIVLVRETAEEKNPANFYHGITFGGADPGNFSATNWNFVGPGYNGFTIGLERDKQLLSLSDGDSRKGVPYRRFEFSEVGISEVSDYPLTMTVTKPGRFVFVSDHSGYNMLFETDYEIGKPYEICNVNTDEELPSSFASAPSTDNPQRAYWIYGLNADESLYGSNRVRRVTVNEASAEIPMTIGLQGWDDDYFFNRLYFFPQNEKSAAVVAIGAYLIKQGNSCIPSTQGYITGEGVYTAGEEVTLKAVSHDANAVFDRWELAYADNSSAARELVAKLDLTQPTLSFTMPKALCGSMADEKGIAFKAIWKPRQVVLPMMVGESEALATAAAWGATISGAGSYLTGSDATFDVPVLPAMGYIVKAWSDNSKAMGAPYIKHIDEGISNSITFLSATIAAPIEENGFKYAVTDSGSILLAYNGTEAKVTVPDTLGGKPVVAIGYPGDWHPGTFAYATSFGFYPRTVYVTSVALPDSVTTIYDEAFAQCAFLESINIPAKVTYIAEGMAWGCPNLKYTVDENNTVYQSDENGYLYTKDSKVLLAAPTARGDFVVPDGVEEIAECAFYYSAGYSISSLTLPASVKRVKDRAFQICSLLTTVYFEGDPPECGAFAFDSITGYYLTSHAKAWKDTFSEGTPYWMFDSVNQAVLYMILQAPTVTDDPGAKVAVDDEGKITITPTYGLTEVVISLPKDVTPSDVTVEVPSTATSVTAKGMKIKVMNPGYDGFFYNIAPYLVIPPADAAGKIDLSAAEVKKKVADEAFSGEGAVLDPSAAATVKLTTAATIPGLTYTFQVGTSLETLADRYVQPGNGQPWVIEVPKVGTSGFYRMRVNYK